MVMNTYSQRAPFVSRCSDRISDTPYYNEQMHPVVLAAAMVFDVLISAGHEGRPASCRSFPQHHCNLGAAGERAWSPIVADAATRILRRHGIAVVRRPADFDGNFRVADAVFIHFDGSSPPCQSGASIGYHRRSDASAARAWRDIYERYFPFRFQPDNFTAGLRDYYAFRQVQSTDASLVLELGEITCHAQHAWLQRRLEWEGALIAYFLSQRIGKGDVPDPGSFRPEAPPQSR